MCSALRRHRSERGQLVIGQLGAVYEILISFTGVVAKTDLIELKPRKGRATAGTEASDQSEEVENEPEDDEDDSRVSFG